VATIEVDVPEVPARRYSWTEIRQGEIYYTAQGRIAYAITPTLVMLINDPHAEALMLASSNDPLHPDRAGTPRFPFTLAPVGSRITLTQTSADQPA
jgi:hypothetical protein